MSDQDTFRVEADYLEEDSSSYTAEIYSKYKRELILAGTTTGLYGASLAISEADKINDAVQHFLG